MRGQVGELLRRYVPPSTLPTPITNGSEELAGPGEESERMPLPRPADSRLKTGGER